MEPKVIYMQKDEEGEFDTWSEEKINDDDVAYVPESSMLALQEENKRYKDALEEYADESNWTIQSDDGSEPDLWHGFCAGNMAAQSALGFAICKAYIKLHGLECEE